MEKLTRFENYVLRESRNPLYLLILGGFVFLSIFTNIYLVFLIPSLFLLGYIVFLNIIAWKRNLIGKQFRTGEYY